MTTTIKVTTHQWPVEVTKTDHGLGASTEILDPHSERDFYIHSTCSLGFVELPEPANGAAPDEDIGDVPEKDGTSEAESGEAA